MQSFKHPPKLYEPPSVPHAVAVAPVPVASSEYPSAQDTGMLKLFLFNSPAQVVSVVMGVGIVVPSWRSELHLYPSLADCDEGLIQS